DRHPHHPCLADAHRDHLGNHPVRLRSRPMGRGTEIGRVRGLGAAKSGVHHWWLQRVTAIANLLLVVWFIVSLVRLPDLGYQTVTDWMAQPLVAVPLILFVV